MPALPLAVADGIRVFLDGVSPQRRRQAPAAPARPRSQVQGVSLIHSVPERTGIVVSGTCQSAGERNESVPFRLASLR